MLGKSLVMALQKHQEDKHIDGTPCTLWIFCGLLLPAQCLACKFCTGISHIKCLCFMVLTLSLNAGWSSNQGLVYFIISTYQRPLEWWPPNHTSPTSLLFFWSSHFREQKDKKRSNKIGRKCWQTLSTDIADQLFASGHVTDKVQQCKAGMLRKRQFEKKTSSTLQYRK